MAPAGFVGAVGAVGPVAGAEGADGVDGGVAEEVGSWAAGPGCADVERVADGFPEVGAPRPIRLTPPEALRCTGYELGADRARAGVGAGAAGGVAAGAVAGVPGLLGLGVGAGEFAAAALWTAGAVPEGALPAAPVAVPVERVTGPLMPLPLPLPGPVVGRTGPDAGLDGPVGLATGEAAELPESACARWTSTAEPLERAAVALEPAEPVEPAEAVEPAEPVEPVEPAEARWTLGAESPGPVAVPRGPFAVLPGPTSVPAGVLVGRLGSVGVPAEAVGVRLESVAARWTWTAELPGAALGPACVLPGVAAAFCTRTGALPVAGGAGGAAAVAAGPGALVPARAAVVSRGPAVDRWTSAAGSAGRVGVAAGAAGVSAVGAGPAVALWTEVGPVAVPLGRVAGLPLPDGVGRTGPGAAAVDPVVAEPEAEFPAGAGADVGAGAGVAAVLPLPEPALDRCTLSAGPVERVTALPGPTPVPPAPAARLLEPVAVPSPDAALTGPAGAASPRPVGPGLPARAGVPTGPGAGARWTLTPAPAEGALVGSPLPGAAEPDGVGPDTAGLGAAGPGIGASVGASDRAGTVGAGPDSAGPEEAGPCTAVAAGAVRRATGRARRCTAGVAGALVSGVCRWGLGGTGVTRGPVGRDAVTGRAARCTGIASPGAWAGAVVSGASAVATGRTREGGSSPGTGPADVVSAFLISPPGAPSRTAWDRVPVREGFCQVLSRPPKPESATPVRPRAARWIGGSPVQPTTAAGPVATAVAGAVRAPAVVEPPFPAAGFASGAGVAPGAERAADDAAPPLSRSKNPTDQPSAPPLVTRDAICSV
ncbi:hypothetical protein OHS59_23990 [Streptomyces sp. NBC_00414]|uniref:hypothetical protein n=1 Tax=Streptomyces sp. NBC_00414 TaxID=2975739 RepID=UPI002E1E14A8